MSVAGEMPSVFDLVNSYNMLREKNEDLYKKVELAVECICKAFEEYGIDGTSISYNGGKDSDVCLQLWRLSLYIYCERLGRLGEYQENVDNTICIAFCCPDDFSEIDQHLKDTVKNIGSQLIRSNNKFKEGLTTIIEHFHTKAIILGVRRTDPQGATLQPHTQSTPDFPPFMRILPILDWTYGDIWEFLFAFSIPYCRLYTEGYTSIGTKKNTFKNKLLLMENGEYSHASMLKEWDQERFTLTGYVESYSCFCLFQMEGSSAPIFSVPKKGQPNDHRL